MKWIELIRVRSSAAAISAAMAALREQVQEIEAVAGAETFFLQHALFGGDLAVVVVWHRDGAPQKTREGLLVAASLRQLGPVDHAVWQPAI